mmetsp:Transcript_7227/g.14860  ORF Transcript_7227/g.14860 Transcript_7227/m.14860 type:complete len:244 (-) Transcript_7227:1524-2255(-)
MVTRIGKTRVRLTIRFENSSVIETFREQIFGSDRSILAKITLPESDIDPLLNTVESDEVIFELTQQHHSLHPYSLHSVPSNEVRPLISSKIVLCGDIQRYVQVLLGSFPLPLLLLLLLSLNAVSQLQGNVLVLHWPKNFLQRIFSNILKHIGIRVPPRLYSARWVDRLAGVIVNIGGVVVRSIFGSNTKVLSDCLFGFAFLNNFIIKLVPLSAVKIRTNICIIVAPVYVTYVHEDGMEQIEIV